MSAPAASTSVGTGSRPLLYPIAAWNGQSPTHSIICLHASGGASILGLSDAEVEAGIKADEQGIAPDGIEPNEAAISSIAASAVYGHSNASSSSSAPSLLPPPLYYSTRTLMSASRTGELVSWESRPPRGVSNVLARIRPRAMCFHSGGSAAITAMTWISPYATGIGVTGAFVVASSEGFMSVWSGAGGRCKRSALVLPFVATRMEPVYARVNTPSATTSTNKSTKSVTSTNLNLSCTPPSPLAAACSTTKTTAYIICSSSASAHIYIVRLPRLAVVGIIGLKATLVASSICNSPDGKGVLLTTLDSSHVVSTWRLSDHINIRSSWAYINGVTSPFGSPIISAANSPVYKPQQAPTLPVAMPVLSISSSPQPAQSSSLPSSPPLLSASAMYVADGVPLFEQPMKTYALPAPTSENTMHDTMSLPHTHLDRDPRPNSPPEEEMAAFQHIHPHSPSLASYHPTSLAISPDSQYVLITHEASFMILNLLTGKLEMQIQSMSAHLIKAKFAQMSSPTSGVAAGSPPLPLVATDHPVFPWSRTDVLIGCGFLADSSVFKSPHTNSNANLVTHEMRFVLWSEEGGMWIFKLHPSAPADASSGSNGKTDPPSHHQDAVNIVTPSTNPPLIVSLFAVCHLHDLHRAADTKTNGNGASNNASNNAILLIPSTVRIDGHRILAGNVEGEIYQYLVPFALTIKAAPSAPIPVKKPAVVYSQLNNSAATTVGASATPTAVSTEVSPTTNAVPSPASGLRVILTEDSSSSAVVDDADSDSIPFLSIDHHYSSSSQLWHIYPSQVIGVSSAFQVKPPPPLLSVFGSVATGIAAAQQTTRPKGVEPPTPHFQQRLDPDDVTSHQASMLTPMNESRSPSHPQSVEGSPNIQQHAHTNSSSQLVSASSTLPSRMVRTRSLDVMPPLPPGTRRMSTLTHAVSHTLTPHHVHGNGSSLSASISLDALDQAKKQGRSRAASTSGPAGAVPSSAQPDDICTVSTMLVDARRKHVMLARGFRSGAIHLVNLCGPVHGTLMTAFVKYSDHDAPRLEIPFVHAGEVSCMVSLEKRAMAGDGVAILLVSGGVDGTVVVTEMQTGRALHVYECGHAVLAIHQPIAVPTIHALVQAQKAGMLYPSTSDRVPASHEIPLATQQPSSSSGDSTPPTLNSEMYDCASPFAATTNTLDYDAIYHTPPNELLFIVCADRCVRSIIVHAHDNISLVSHIHASPFASVLKTTQFDVELQCNTFVQIYRGAESHIQNVYYNSFTHEHDLLITQDVHGILYVYTCSTGDLEQTIDDPAEVEAFLQNFDLLRSHSQLSLMAYQLRQLAAFAPGLFQLATDTNLSGQQSTSMIQKGKLEKAQLLQEIRSTNLADAAAAAGGAHHDKHSRNATLPSGHTALSMRAITFAKTAMRRFSNTLGGNSSAARRRSIDGSGLLFGSSSLGSALCYHRNGDHYFSAQEANQNHILGTYILNRFLFHQQNPSFNASILSTVVNGLGMGGADGTGGNIGNAAIVYRPSLLKRSSHGAQSLKSMDLHIQESFGFTNSSGGNSNGGWVKNRFNHLQLSVYALDMQRVNLDILTRYAALTSSTSATSHSRQSSATPVGAFDPKREGQAAWHSLLTMLFDWDDGVGSIGNMLKQHLDFHHPSSYQAYAIFSDRAQAMTVLFPSHSHAHRRWTFDPEVSASHMLALSSILHSLVHSSDSQQRVYWDKVISYYHHHLPRQLPFYIEPDLTYLALYALNASENIHVAARSLMQGVVERSTVEQRAKWWKEWSTTFGAGFGPTVTAGGGGVPAVAASASSSSGTSTPEKEPIWKRNLFSQSLIKQNSSHDLNTPSANGSGSKLTSSQSTSALNNKRKSQIGSPTSASTSSTNASASSSSSSSSSSSIAHPKVDLVSDKLFMSTFVLATLYFFEANSIRWAKREERFKNLDTIHTSYLGMTGIVSEAANVSSGALAAVSAGASAAAAASASSSAASASGYKLGSTGSFLLNSSNSPPVTPTSASNLSEMEAKVPYIVHILLRQLAYNSHQSGPIIKPTELVKLSLSCDILSHGLSTFLQFIPPASMPLLIRRLQYLSLNSNLVEKVYTSSSSQPSVSTSASISNYFASSHHIAHVESAPLLALHIQLYHSSRKLLLELGKYLPDLLIFIIGKEMLLKHIHKLPSIERMSYMNNLISLVRKYPKNVNAVLLDFVHTLIKSVHPNEPSVRQQFLPLCIDVLRSLENLYQQTSFHEASGHFAIGTSQLTYHTIKDDGHSSTRVSSTSASKSSQTSAPLEVYSHWLIGESGVVYRPQLSAHPFCIMIFDLKTAGKWRVLEGHKATVTAVQFNAAGSLLASYSATDQPSPTLRVWKLGESGLLNDLLHSHGKQLKLFTLQRIDLRDTIARELLLSQKQSYLNQQRKANTQQVRVERVGLQVPIHHQHNSSSSLVSPMHAPTPAQTILPNSPIHHVTGSGTEQIAAAGLMGLASSGASSASASSPSHHHHHIDSSRSLPTTPAAARSLPTHASSPSTVPTTSNVHTTPTPSSVSSIQLDEEDDTPEGALTSKMMSVRLKWTGDSTVTLTREDGSTETFEL